MSLSLQITVIILVLFFSAYFSGMEIAFVSSSKLRYEMDKADRSLSSRILGVFYRHPGNFISTMLVGNNIVLVVYSILMAKLLDPLWSRIPLLQSEFAMLLLDTVISTLLVIIFGEFLPKTIFRYNPNGSLRALSVPSGFFYVLLYPITVFSSWCAKTMLRLFGIKNSRETTKKAFSKTDLDDLIESSIASGDEPASTEVQIFQNALDFSNLRVRDCMIPRNEIASVDKDCSTEELIQKFVETGYSKIVVFDGSIDNIIGYIHSSELFRAHPAPLNPQKESKGSEPDEQSSLPSLWEGMEVGQLPLRKMPIVPETASAQKLMKTLMQQKLSLAVVVDEFGGTAGIVALEDIMEELTGDIEDEHDTTSYVAKAIGKNSYILSARLEIEKVEDLFDIGLPTSDDYYTIGGLILNTCHSIPAVGQTINVAPNFQFRILKAVSNKITLVRLDIR